MTPRIRSLPLLLLSLAGFVAVRAQNSLPTIAITGTVLDQNAAALAGAQVTLKGSEPSRALSAITDASGVFRFEKLNAGVYEILVTREGFKPATARVTIGGRAPAPLRIIMPVG
ncbi:MAG TPA: carboxypeptidase-like regulatory domain-containing protein, partial [Blastocatellia bacterium]|nr:carboxypeptidase-like regulatory domain-containing protein [Blastocatellia bacterium]